MSSSKLLSPVNYLSNFNDSLTSNSTNFLPPHPQNILYWTVVTLTICVVGCLTNSLVLYATWPRAADKSGVNLLIFHFITANFLSCLFHFPIRVIMVQAKQSGYPTIGDAWCPPIQFFLNVNWLVVYWADAGLAINRCVALFFPHRYKAFSTTRKNVLQITCLWLAAIALTIPYFFRVGNYITKLPIGHCATRAVNSPWFVFFAIFKYAPFVLGGVAAMLLLGKCYLMSRTDFYLRRSEFSRESSGSHPSDLSGVHRIRQRIRLAKLLVVAYGYAFLSNIPAELIIVTYPAVFERDPVSLLWLQTCSVSHYAFIACIFLFSDSKYRRRLPWSDRSRVLPIDNNVSKVEDFGKNGSNWTKGNVLDSL